MRTHHAFEPEARIVSFLSGVLWGGIALLLADGAFGDMILVGLLASPLIGLLIGRLATPLADTPPLVRGCAALALLYVSATLFGAAMGIAGQGPFSSGERVFEVTIAVLWGLTFSGYVLWLWPLAILNHQLIWSIVYAARAADED